MKISAKTDIGCVRSENQDNYRACRVGNGKAWAVVCDGMGGYKGGAIASQLAVESFELYMNKAVQNEDVLKDPHSMLKEAIEAMNQRVYAAACADPELSDMGTTAVCLWFNQGCIHVAHVGDSRAYLSRNHRIIRLTKDHSIVQQLIDNGDITEEQARKHPRKNQITRAIGVSQTIESDYAYYPLAGGDRVLLCSDGLYNPVEEEMLEETISQTQFYELPDKLIERALHAGGADNITAVVLSVETGEV